MKKTSILFGSGISLISGLPGTTDLNDLIRNYAEVGYNPDSNFYIHGYLGSEKQGESRVDRAKIIIDFLWRRIESFYSKYPQENRVTNYEDVAYGLRQIVDTQMFEFENPLLGQFIDEIDEIALPMLSSGENTNYLYSEALRYIKCIVWQKLDGVETTLKQFRILEDIQKNFKLISINTLNHDLLLEKYLDQQGIPFNDGFVTKQNCLPEFSLNFHHHLDTITLNKLHGSIDWFYCHKGTPPDFPDYVLLKIPRNFYHENIERHYKSYHRINSIPQILVGTFNKMIDYADSPFDLIIKSFKEALEDSDFVIVAGYGFGDKGINQYLFSTWLPANPHRRMLIVHPNPDNLKKTARGQYKLEVSGPFNQGNDSIKIIPKKFEDVGIEDILHVLE